MTCPKTFVEDETRPKPASNTLDFEIEKPRAEITKEERATINELLAALGL
jgi:hypothetical protein